MSIEKSRVVLLSILLMASAAATDLAGADALRKGKTTLVSTLPSGDRADGGYPSLSSDGRYVAFESFDQLIPDDTDLWFDIYRKDMTTGEIKLVSVDWAGVPKTVCNTHPSISGDGTKVVYLVGGNDNLISPQFSGGCYGHRVALRDLTLGQTKWIVGPSSGYFSDGAEISNDGRWVVTDLEYDGAHWVGVFDATTGTQSWISAATCGGCWYFGMGLSISDNGRFVVYDSELDRTSEDKDGRWDVFLHDRDLDGNGVLDETGTGKTRTALVGILPNGSSPDTKFGSISGDGTTVAFFSPTNMYRRNLTTSSTEMVPFPLARPLSVSFDERRRLALSTDGRYFVFTSFDYYLSADLSISSDVFMWDHQTKKVFLLSLRPDGNQGPEDGMYPAISADGRYVAFQLKLASHQGVTFVNSAVYRRDLQARCELACVLD